ncbi:MAG: DUF3048 domain-containing protein [Clostridia bacterium]|nr:DUF3048 domain-containing protein [Clostridia bacterium]
MKKFVCIVLVALMALACAASAEGSNVSITTGRPTNDRAHTMVVQLDNEPGARPQKGIASADIVYEIELYNGGFTRYTAVFNDTIPAQVEAVRSARIVNVDVYSEYNGAFVHFGGQKYEGSSVYDYFGTMNFGARWDGIGMDGGSDFYRDRSRKAPNNVVCELQSLFSKTDWNAIACKSPLKFNAAPTIPAAGEDVVNFQIAYKEGYTPSYVWDANVGKYLRYYNGMPFVDGTTQEQITCDNVIVQSMEYGWYSGESDRPKVTTVGSNRCEYFIGGRHFSGYWVRDNLGVNTVYYDNNGAEVLFNPGTTYIEMLKTEKSVDILG